MNPYCAYHGLEADFRPIGHPEADPQPPAWPFRLRMFLYGCAMYAAEHEARLAGAKQATKMGGG